MSDAQHGATFREPKRDDDDRDDHDDDKKDRDDDDDNGHGPKPNDDDHRPKPNCRYLAEVLAEQVDGALLYRWKVTKTFMESGTSKVIGNGTRADPNMAWTEAQAFADRDREADLFGTQTMEV